MNVCKAVWAALRGQRDPEDVARARGRKLVDVSDSSGLVEATPICRFTDFDAGEEGVLFWSCISIHGDHEWGLSTSEHGEHEEV